MAGGAARIAMLPESVVHRIAAGEVIQRPANALKELLDNSVDACASAVRVVVKGGGLQSLQVSDDGCGVRDEDLELLCVRHATSKMRSAEDLREMATLGFRGEALASMSYVAHVSCVTRMRAQQHEEGDDGGVGEEAAPEHATRATYRDGRLVDSSACAGTYGTTITVEDLFYASPLRKKALRSPSDEYRRIVDVVSRYAVHHRGIAFTCRRQEDGMKPPDVQVGNVDSLKTRIDLVFGRAVANELIEISVTASGAPGRHDEDATPGASCGGGARDAAAGRSGAGAGDTDESFSVRGFVTSANYHASRTTMVLFINDRLVEMTPLRRAVESVYASILPKASKPFLYFSIETPQRNVDVNVHPTKHEVGLVNAESIVHEVQAAVERLLLESNDGRTYVFSQSERLGGGGASGLQLRRGQRDGSDDGGAASDGAAGALAMKPEAAHARASAAPPRPAVYAPNRLVRTDAASVPLEAFALGSQQLQTMGRRNFLSTQATVRGSERVREPDGDADEDDASANPSSPATGAGVTSPALALIQAFEAKTSMELRTFFRGHVYVGMLTPDKAVVQFRTGLYAINAVSLSQELCYQLLLRAAANRQLGSKHRDIDAIDGVDGVHNAGLGDAAGTGASVDRESTIAFEGNGVPVGETIRRALHAMEEDGDWEPEDGSGACVAALVFDIVRTYGSWMHDAFNVRFVGAFESGGGSDIGDGGHRGEGGEEKGEQKEVHLKGLPACFGPRYVPDLGRVPDFFLAMARDVDWGGKENIVGDGNETERMRTFCRALAELYTFVDDENEGPRGAADGGIDAGQPLSNGAWKMQHVICPLLKASLCPPQEMNSDGTVVMITKLEKLYKVFERC